NSPLRFVSCILSEKDTAFCHFVKDKSTVFCLIRDCVLITAFDSAFCVTAFCVTAFGLKIMRFGHCVSSDFTAFYVLLGKENGVNILQSIDNGLIKWELREIHLGQLMIEMIPGENITDYYVRFHKFVNDMRNIKMTLPNIQLNSKFVNNMIPEWDRVVIQTVQGRQTPNQRNFAWGKGATGSGEQANTYDADVDDQPVHDMAQNDPNIFQADDCDAFDSDVDDEPTAQTIFIGNLSSAVSSPSFPSGTPASFSIEEDAPSTSISSSSVQRSPYVHQGVVVNHTLAVKPFALVDDVPFVNIFALDPSSKATSSKKVSPADPNQYILPHRYLRKSTNFHPVDNIIWNLSRPVSTSKQLATDTLWCFYNFVLSKVEPKNFKSAVIKDCWFEAMQEEIHEFDCL
nr:hypothetical protein [Tanacetum cinerariifolium]